MKEILFIRHAKSDQTLWNTGISDVDRPLNERGRKDALLMRKELQRTSWRAEAVFCSKAARTRETLSILQDDSWIDVSQIFYESDLYTFDYEEVIEFIRALPDQYSCIAIVGHNPALQFCIMKLGGVQIDNLPTTGMYRIGTDTDTWEDFVHKKGAVLWKAYPSEFR